MTHTVDVYLNNVKVSSGTATAGSATIASTTDTANLYGIYAGRLSDPFLGKPVTVHCTSGTNSTGRSWRTRLITDNGTSLVMSDVDPFAD